MELKKLLKSLGFSEQFTSKSRVFSGFGLGVIASLLLLTVLFLNHPLKASFLFPVFQGFNGIRSKPPIVSWPFQFPTASYVPGSSVLHNFTNSDKGDDGVALQRSKNGSSFNSNDVGSVKNQTHEGIPTDMSKNSSFLDSSGVILVPEKPQSGNFSHVNGDNLVPERHASPSKEVGSVSEKPLQGNLSNSTSTENFTTSVENNRNGSSVGIADKGIEKKNVGNYSDSEQTVRSSVLAKTHEQNSTKEHVNDFANCDIFDGRWVRDKGKPLYPAGSCPYIDKDFNCHLNGRPDEDFMKWRWQPNHCNIPSLNATDFLERLRGKRLVFVGDSLNRNMWESLVCILRHSVADKKKVYEISGKSAFKKKGFYAFHYEEYNCSVDFVSSPFLVRETSTQTRHGLMETLRLDLMDLTASMYHDADVIVFNTGHWWTHEKTSKGENYYQEGNHVYPRLKVMDAYTKALSTWARWAEKNVDVHKSQVFFRGYSVTHFKGGQWNSGGQCHKETEPIYNETYLAKYPSKMRALEHVLEKMKTPVVYLNISKLTDYRKDAHPSIYRKEYKTEEEKHAAEGSQDCSHWCLPGVPDTWNELLYASLLKTGRGSWGN